MHFVFAERRYWERSGTHTFVREDDPAFERLASGGTGRVRTYVNVWLADWRAPGAYVGGVWASGGGLRRSALRRIARNVTLRAGAERAQLLLPRLAALLRRFERDAP